MPQTRQTFSKSERLCSLKLIESLIKGGNVVFSYPFRAMWSDRCDSTDVPVQVMMAVSKKNFRNATERNRIKRVMREAYRKNKEILYVPLRERGRKIALMIQYTGKEMPSYKKGEESMRLLLAKVASGESSGTLPS